MLRKQNTQKKVPFHKKKLITRLKKITQNTISTTIVGNKKGCFVFTLDVNLPLFAVGFNTS